MGMVFFYGHEFLGLLHQLLFISVTCHRPPFSFPLLLCCGVSRVSVCASTERRSGLGGVHFSRFVFVSAHVVSLIIDILFFIRAS